MELTIYKFIPVFRFWACWWLFASKCETFRNFLSFYAVQHIFQGKSFWEMSYLSPVADSDFLLCCFAVQYKVDKKNFDILCCQIYQKNFSRIQSCTEMGLFVEILVPILIHLTEKVFSQGSFCMFNERSVSFTHFVVNVDSFKFSEVCETLQQFLYLFWPEVVPFVFFVIITKKLDQFLRSLHFHFLCLQFHQPSFKDLSSFYTPFSFFANLSLYVKGMHQFFCHGKYFR